jgi:MFS family permease
VGIGGEQTYYRDMASADIALHQHDSIQVSEDGAEYELFRMETPENAQPAMLPVSRQRQFSILLCAFFDVFITIGMNQAYGVFLTYYLDPVNNEREAFLSPQQLNNKALIAFVGTLGAGLTWGGSIFVNPLMTRVKDPRKLTLVGAILIGLGYVLASFSRSVYYLPCLIFCRAIELSRTRSGSYC